MWQVRDRVLSFLIFFLIQLDSTGLQVASLYLSLTALSTQPLRDPCTCLKQRSTIQRQPSSSAMLLQSGTNMHKASPTSTHTQINEPLMSWINIHRLLPEQIILTHLPFSPCSQSFRLCFQFPAFLFRTISHPSDRFRQMSSLPNTTLLEPLLSCSYLLSSLPACPFSRVNFPSQCSFWLSPHPCSLSATSPALPKVTNSLWLPNSVDSAVLPWPL